MNKPLTMIINETKKTIYDAINNAGVHPIIIRDMILKDIYLELNKCIEDTVKQEHELYYNELAKTEITNDELEQESAEE